MNLFEYFAIKKNNEGLIQFNQYSEHDWGYQPLIMHGLSSLENESQPCRYKT